MKKEEDSNLEKMSLELETALGNIVIDIMDKFIREKGMMPEFEQYFEKELHERLDMIFNEKKGEKNDDKNNDKSDDDSKKIIMIDAFLKSRNK